MRYKLLDKSGLRVSEVCQVESSLEHLGFVLPEEDMRALDELSAPERSWTYNLLHAEDSRIRQLASCGMLDEIDNDNFPA